MTELPLYRSHVTRLLDNVPSHGVPGVMWGVAFHPGYLTNLIIDGLSLQYFVGTPQE